MGKRHTAKSPPAAVLLEDIHTFCAKLANASFDHWVRRSRFVRSKDIRGNAWPEYG
jgi:hypothetical protein